MKFMKFYILTFLILASTITFGRGNGIYPEKQVEKYARISLKDKDIFLKKQLSVEETLNKEEPVTLYLFGKNDGPDFYVIITQAKGRYDLFDYLVAANTDVEIQNVRVLKYRSEHGGEIGSKKWLKQFVGYSSGDLRYKKDISAISGATLSAKAITADIQQVMEIVRKNVQ